MNEKLGACLTMEHLQPRFCVVKQSKIHCNIVVEVNLWLQKIEYHHAFGYISASLERNENSKPQVTHCTTATCSESQNTLTHHVLQSGLYRLLSIGEMGEK